MNEKRKRYTIYTRLNNGQWEDDVTGDSYEAASEADAIEQYIEDETSNFIDFERVSIKEKSRAEFRFYDEDDKKWSVLEIEAREIE